MSNVNTPWKTPKKSPYHTPSRGYGTPKLPPTSFDAMKYEELRAYEDQPMPSVEPVPAETVVGLRLLASSVLCLGFMCFGASMSMIGPAILEFGCLIDRDIGDLSWLFFAQSGCALLGAIISAIVADRFKINFYTYIGILMTVHAGVIAMIPYMRSLTTMIAAVALHGLFGGCQDTATNLKMILMHGPKVPPFLQTMFFFYGMGAFFSPLIMGNFLNEECNSRAVDEAALMFLSRRSFHPSNNWVPWSSRPRLHELALDVNATRVHLDETQVHNGFWAVALMHLVVTIMFWVVVYLEKRLLRGRAQLDYQSNVDLPDDFDTDVGEPTPAPVLDSVEDSRALGIRKVTACIAAMVFISDGLQGAFGSYIYTYAVEVGYSADAAYLNSLFWGSLASGRLCAIFISIFVTPQIMLLTDIIGVVLSAAGMLIFRSKQFVLWLGVTVFGLCLSNVFPTSVSLAEQYFRLTGVITCIFVTTSGTGEMLVSILIGRLLGLIGPTVLMTGSVILGSIAIFLFIGVIWSGRSLRAMDLERENASRNECESSSGMSMVPTTSTSAAADTARVSISAATASQQQHETASTTDQK